MEERLLKLMAQLGLIAVVVWALAGAFGRRNEVALKNNDPGRALRRAVRDSQGNKWMNSGIQAESAQTGLAGLAPGYQLVV